MSTSRRWPACSAPIVGTNPRRRPSRRSAAARRCRAPGARTISGALATVAVLLAREPPAAHILHERRERRPRRFGQLGVALHELGHAGLVQPEQIVEHEDLAVAMRPSADADGGDSEL